MKFKFLSYITDYITTFLFRNTVFFSDKQYQFEARTSSFSIRQTPTSPAKVIVLGRKYYTEQLEWLPISRRSEVEKIAKVKVKQSSNILLYVIGTHTNGKTPVMYYQVNIDLQPLKPWLVIPETWLLGMLSNEKLVHKYQTLGSATECYFIRHNTSIVTSSLQGGIITTSEQFAFSQGLSTNKCADINWQTLLSAIKFDFVKFKYRALMGYLNINRSDTRGVKSEQLIKYLVALVLSGTVYLSCAYWLADYAVSSRKETLAVLMKNANGVIEQNNKTEEMIKRYQFLADQIPKQHINIALWDILLPLYQNGVSVTNIERNNASVSIRFTADSASAIMQLLLNNPQVTNVTFESPVRRQRDKDVASISFEII